VSGARAGRWIVVLVLAAALGAQVVRAWRRVEATHLLLRAEERTLALARRGAPDPRELRRNLVLLERAATLHSSLVAIPIARGSQFLLLGRNDQAIAAYQEALALEPRVETHYNLGRAYLAAGDEKSARRNLERAARASPRLRSDVRRLLGDPD